MSGTSRRALLRAAGAAGLAGANHGTETCGPCRKGTGSAEPCNVISPLCADEPGETLYDLNHYDPEGVGTGEPSPRNETPVDVDYYTVRGGLDYFYPTQRESPELAGATNVLLLGRAHNATRASRLRRLRVATSSGPRRSARRRRRSGNG